MGSGRNESLSVSRSARDRASTRTAIHFWLDVPMYEYDLPCGIEHVLLSRTPVVARANKEGIPIEDFCIVWCDRCREYTVLDSEEPEPSNRVALEQIAHTLKAVATSVDDAVSFEQDKGALRERIAQAIQDRGYLATDEQVREFAITYGVPVAEIKKLNAGLKAPDTSNGQPNMCQAGLHEMTVDNIAITRGRKQCKACRTLAQRKRRADKRG